MLFLQIHLSGENQVPPKTVTSFLTTGYVSLRSPLVHGAPPLRIFMAGKDGHSRREQIGRLGGMGELEPAAVFGYRLLWLANETAKVEQAKK